MRFTDRTIRALKAKALRYEIWQDGLPGFGIRVSTKSRKSWIFLYRFHGRSRRLTLGTFPAMGLAEAHVKHAEAVQRLMGGVDPGTEVVAQRAAERRGSTVAELAEEYLERWARPNKRSAFEDERMLRKDVLPFWRARKVNDIGRRDVITLLDRLVDRGAPIQANRTRSLLRRMYNFGVDRGIVDANPCLLVKAPAKERQRDRVLTDAEILAFWRGLDGAGMSTEIRLVLRLMLTTSQRKGEIINAEWCNFEFESALWTIPSDKSKNGRAHDVPLSGLALSLLGRIRALSTQPRWLFPSPRGVNHITGPAVDHALRNNRDSIGIVDLVPHDLRRTAASGMTRMGINRLVVSKILNHVDGSVTAVYDRYSYDAEKRHALDAWGRRLEEIISGTPAKETTTFSMAAGREPT